MLLILRSKSCDLRLQTVYINNHIAIIRDQRLTIFHA